jgi:hypothetical protein
MSFSQVQRMFLVENYLVSRSFLTFQNEFRDKSPDFPVLNKSTNNISSGEPFPSKQKLFTGLHQTGEKE